MKSLEVTDDTISIISQYPIFILSFTSPWCASCKKVSSHLETNSSLDTNQIGFGTIDISKNTQIAAQYQVFSIPTIILFKQGKEIKRLSGAISNKEIDSEIKRLL